MVAHTRIHSKIVRRQSSGGCQFQACWAKCLLDPIPTNKKLGMVVCTYHPSYIESINRRIMVQASHGINMRPYLKIPKAEGWR
jgi:hypothetical protein